MSELEKLLQAIEQEVEDGNLPRGYLANVDRVREEAAQRNTHPDGKWKCRACKSVWDGSQLVLDPMSTEVKWTCGDYFCGGSCDRIVIGE